MPKSEVFNSDCLEAMRQMPDKTFDLAIVDPPYGINAAKGLGRSTRISVAKGKYIGGNWDNAVPSLEYFIELERVSANRIIWGGNYFPHLPTYNPKAKRLDDFRQLKGIVWDKGETMYGRDFSEAEIAFSTVGSGWYKLSPVQKVRFHPTQKPLQLYRYLLSTFANPGDSILDTHMGSQTLRVAAYQLGFDFTGFEINEKYFLRGCSYFKEASKIKTLF